MSPGTERRFIEYLMALVHEYGAREVCRVLTKFFERSFGSREFIDAAKRETERLSW